MSDTYNLYTLIDISNGNKIGLKNFNSILQTIGITAQPHFDETPVICPLVDIKGYKFGTGVKGNHNVWKFEFKIEPDDVFVTDDAKFGLLVYNVNNVPVSLSGHETAKFPVSAFITIGKTVNTYIELIEKDDTE